jgi:hypothetical protein
MRFVFFLLLFLDVAVFAYVYSDEHRADAEAQRLQLQINSEKMKILKGGPGPGDLLPKPATSMTAPSPLVCLEWGSFEADEVPRAEAALAKLDLRDKLALQHGEGAFWVYIPPFKSKADADKKAGELKAIGVSDFAIIDDSGRRRFAISLGVFTSEEAAGGYLAQLKLKGVRSAIVGPREGEQKTTFVIRDPGDAAVARIAELKPEFPNAQLKATACAGAVAARQD